MYSWQIISINYNVKGGGGTEPEGADDALSPVTCDFR